jgi:hypothetical protein
MEASSRVGGQSGKSYVSEVVESVVILNSRLRSAMKWLLDLA